MGAISTALLVLQLLPIFHGLFKGVGNQFGSSNLPSIPGLNGVLPPAPKPTLMNKVGNVSGALGTLTGMALPYVMSSLGRGAQAAGETGGAAVQALANAPGHIIRNMRSDAQRQTYGGNIFEGLGDILSDVGGVAAAGVRGAGNVVGGLNQDIGNAVRMKQLQTQYLGHMGDIAKQLQGMNLPAGAWGAYQRLATAMNQGTRGLP
jgi:hypothetical protein